MGPNITVTIKLKGQEPQMWSAKQAGIQGQMLVLIGCTNKDVFFNLDSIEYFDLPTEPASATAPAMDKE